MPATIDTRLCETCFTTKAVAEFRLRSCGGKHQMRQCRERHNAAERRRMKAKRDGRLAECLTRLQGERNHKRVVALCDAMLAEFGGVAGFIAAWRDYYSRSLKEGGLGALKSFQAYLRLVRFCEH